MTVRHVVIIGAARSGTKMLRDTLSVAAGVGKVPYDIGYVWRYGSERVPDDVIDPARVSARARGFIRSFVDRYAAGAPPGVIEKTVGNTMRVPAVAAVLPDAVFIQLIRDGVDVIESTRRQWQAPADRRYLLAKMRHFPMRLVPSYGVTYARSMAHRIRDPEHRLGSWGPRYPGIDADLRTVDLLTVCARQWREAVVRARRDLGELPVGSLEVRYEQFVADPEGELARISDFAGFRTGEAALRRAAATVDGRHRGTGRARLTPAEMECLEAEVGHVLRDLGYEPPVCRHDLGSHQPED